MNGPSDKLKAIKTERRQQKKGDNTIFDQTTQSFVLHFCLMKILLSVNFLFQFLYIKT